MLRPRTSKPRAMGSTEVERLLRDAAASAATELPEPSPDLVARAVDRALTSEERRQRSRRSLLDRGVSRPVAFGAFTVAGIVAWAVAIAVPFAPRPSRTAANPMIARAVTQTATISPIVGTNASARPPFTRLAVAAQAVHRSTSPRLIARRHRRQTQQRAAPTRLSIALSPSATTTKTPTTAAPMIAVAVPRSRPFWHDEQVERDDYVVAAPAIIAEGTGQEVTSLTPAVVQVAFSTIQPIAASSAVYDTENGNPQPN